VTRATIDLWAAMTETELLWSMIETKGGWPILAEIVMHEPLMGDIDFDVCCRQSDVGRCDREVDQTGHCGEADADLKSVDRYEVKRDLVTKTDEGDDCHLKSQLVNGDNQETQLLPTINHLNGDKKETQLLPTISHLNGQNNTTNVRKDALLVGERERCCVEMSAESMGRC